MRTNDFSFEVPEGLIAQRPPSERGASRLMIVDRAAGRIAHARIRDLPDWVPARALMVLNDTRVIPARLFGRSTETQGIVEVLLLREEPPNRWQALVSKARRQRVGKRIAFPEGRTGCITAAEAEIRWIRFDPPIDLEYLERNGHVPLPPYIRRNDEALDAERYQTVYARVPGSAAAPTAGLHLTEDVLSSLATRGVELAYVTLHVGLGTFAPIRAERIEDHQMHEERYRIPERTARAVAEAAREGRTVLAVGTTVVRALESAARDPTPGDGWRSTDLFITPGYRFAAVNALLTNFHTPRSTLFVLVSAFGGLQLMRRAYEEAIRCGYRFFSYGDAMLIL